MIARSKEGDAMKWPFALTAASIVATTALAADAPKQSGVQLLSTRLTSSGQPIPAPSKTLQVTATVSEIAPGQSTPVHRHPYLRYDYVLEGRLAVTNFVTGKVDIVTAGQFVVDPIDQWHQGRALDGKRVRILLIDQTPFGQSNLVLKGPATR
jgi:quercetin dioxygenase-like cupin family protein